MSKSVLDAKAIHDEAAAYAWVEARLWPDGPVCPHCGCLDRISKMQGKSTRIGVYKCYHCRKQFSVKVGTVFEDSHVPMHFWLQAVYLMCSSKKGVSSNQLHRTLGVTLKTAWFMSHRIREAMRGGPLSPMGGDGGDVEVDETFIWRDPDARPTPKHANPSWVEKMKVLSLIDRDSGEARSFVVDSLSAEDIHPILRENIAKEARLMTDEAKRYVKIGQEFAAHETVNHGEDEYVSREDASVHVNSLEGYFSIFKRGMKGVYQHASKRHLHRYVAEFDFRYSNRVRLGVDDVRRTELAVKGVVGKRLTYRTTGI